MVFIVVGAHRAGLTRATGRENRKAAMPLPPSDSPIISEAIGSNLLQDFCKFRTRRTLLQHFCEYRLVAATGVPNPMNPDTIQDYVIESMVDSPVGEVQVQSTWKMKGSTWRTGLEDVVGVLEKLVGVRFGGRGGGSLGGGFRGGGWLFVS